MKGVLSTIREILRDKVSLDIRSVDLVLLNARGDEPSNTRRTVHLQPRAAVESAGGRRSDTGLAEAQAVRILELDGEHLRFTDPLLGSAVTARQTPSRRWSLHTRLAKIVPTAEERARHLALATAKPSPEIASIMYEAGMRLELGDLFEALIATDELDRADEVLATWEARAGALGRAWALVILARCRALLLAARGNLHGASAIFERALAEHFRSADPFQHARTLLVFGRT